MGVGLVLVESWYTGFVLWPPMWLSLMFFQEIFIVCHVLGAPIVSGATQLIKS